MFSHISNLLVYHFYKSHVVWKQIQNSKSKNLDLITEKKIFFFRMLINIKTKNTQEKIRKVCILFVANWNKFVYIYKRYLFNWPKIITFFLIKSGSFENFYFGYWVVTLHFILKFPYLFSDLAVMVLCVKMLVKVFNTCI